MQSIRTPRFGITIFCLLLAALFHARTAAAMSISPSPSTNGAYTVNWGVPLGCTYTNVDGWVWTSDCWMGRQIGGPYYTDTTSTSITGKPPGTYTYEVWYEYSWIEFGIPTNVYSYPAESVSVQVLPATPPPPPPAWSLTNDQRRAYLRHYAPVIFKRANENTGSDGWISSLVNFIPNTLFHLMPGLGFDVGGAGANVGFDWITNFYFDGNDNFGDNKHNWKNSIARFIKTTSMDFTHWYIRPTLYTAAIEFMDQDSKELILIYHIYHAMDETSGSTSPPFGDKDESIHDWERIEVHLKNVTGPPGTGEQVLRTVITQHKRHLVRSGSTAQFLVNYTGNHLMVFQAEWSGAADTTPHGQELRYVEQSWASISAQRAANNNSDVFIQGEGYPQEVHYVFVPEDSSATVAEFGAWPIYWVSTRFASFSGRDNEDSIAWDKTRRLTYELQDLADIFPTHAAANNATQSWVGEIRQVRITDPIYSETGVLELGTGLHSLTTGSADIEEPGLNGTREGYPDKSWWWGCYGQNGGPGIGSAGDGFCDDAKNGTHYDSRGKTRLSAGEPSLFPTAGFFQQHDYYVHSTPYADSSLDVGFYLAGDWYKPAKGGFDGRYVQLFDDRRPLQVTQDVPWNFCSYEYYPMNVNDGFMGSVTISGAKSPYTLTWTVDGSSWQTGYPTGGFFYFPYGSAAAVTVNAANGESVTVTINTEVKCVGTIS